mmetsp:Transcript_29683/g.81262  ORF Transcript_29683/g.81262 Transcript_29683/m.81262 type:complete len:326 (+) Transcript_29683:559-1536(+)
MLLHADDNARDQWQTGKKLVPIASQGVAQCREQDANRKRRPIAQWVEFDIIVNRLAVPSFPQRDVEDLVANHVGSETAAVRDHEGDHFHLIGHLGGRPVPMWENQVESEQSGDEPRRAVNVGLERFEPTLHHGKGSQRANRREVGQPRSIALVTFAVPENGAPKAIAKRRLHEREGKDEREAIQRVDGREAPDHERHPRIGCVPLLNRRSERETRDEKEDLHPILAETAETARVCRLFCPDVNGLIQSENGDVHRRQGSKAVERSQPNQYPLGGAGFGAIGAIATGRNVRLNCVDNGRSARGRRVRVAIDTSRRPMFNVADRRDA